MTGNDKRAEGIILSLLGIPVVIWLGLIFAPYLESGLIDFILKIGNGNIESLMVTLCSESFKSVVLFLLLYAFGIALYFSTRKNYRRGEEHGSAKSISAEDSVCQAVGVYHG